jgi:hypothetical protein
MSEFLAPTPRTDKIANAEHASQFEYSRAMTVHARDLERELFAAVQTIGELTIGKTRPVLCNASAPVCHFKPRKKVAALEPTNKFEALSNDQVFTELRKLGVRGAQVREAA